MKSVTALNALGEPRRPFLVVDPGKRCGLCLYVPPPFSTRARMRPEPPVMATDTCPIDDLPAKLHSYVTGQEFGRFAAPAFVVCEDFRLAGGNRSNAGATDMPASRGIGMCQMACFAADIELFMAQRGVKRAGACALDTYGRSARAAAHNDHERDAVDLCGYVLRQMRLPS